MNATGISNSDDVIDSRDIIARIEELESGLQEGYDKEESEDKPTFEDWLDEIICNGDYDFPVDDAKEYQILKSLADEAEGSPDWTYGETLIRESYFEDYARELAEDIGAIDPKANWPLNHIDWEAAADELKGDYMEVDFDGVSYYIRA
jgi:hypothetical protein